MKAPTNEEDSDSDDDEASWRIQSGCILGMVFTRVRETEHDWRAQESKPKTKKKKKKDKEAHGENGEGKEAHRENGEWQVEKGGGKGFQKGPA